MTSGKNLPWVWFHPWTTASTMLTLKIFQFGRGRNKANITALLDQSPNPPIIVEFLQNKNKIIHQSLLNFQKYIYTNLTTSFELSVENTNQTYLRTFWNHSYQYCLQWADQGFNIIYSTRTSAAMLTMLFRFCFFSCNSPPWYEDNPWHRKRQHTHALESHHLKTRHRKHWSGLQRLLA